MNKMEWVWKDLQSSPAHPPITLPCASPGHALCCFPFLTFYSLFFFPSCLENLDCLTSHPLTPKNCAVESCGRGCACAAFAAVNYLSRAEGGGSAHLQFLFLFCAARGRGVGSLLRAGAAWPYSPSTNLSCWKGSRSLPPSLPPHLSWCCPCDRASSQESDPFED